MKTILKLKFHILSILLLLVVNSVYGQTWSSIPALNVWTITGLNPLRARVVDLTQTTFSVEFGLEYGGVFNTSGTAILVDSQYSTTPVSGSSPINYVAGNTGAIFSNVVHGVTPGTSKTFYVKTIPTTGSIRTTNLIQINATPTPQPTIPGVWEKLGNQTFNGWIETIAHDSQNNIYVGGRFANSLNNYTVYKWNGSSWSDLGLNVSDLGWIKKIIVDSNNNVYVAFHGFFPSSSGVIKKWNGTTWQNITIPANTLTGVYDMQKDSNNNIYIAGIKSLSNTSTVLKWNGTSWATVGNAVNGAVNKITINDNNELFITGTFKINNKYYVAKLVNNTWTQFSQLLDDWEVYSMESVGSNIYVGTIINGTEVLLKSSGNMWENIFSNNYAETIHKTHDNQFYTAGRFSNFLSVRKLDNNQLVICGTSNSWGDPLWGSNFNYNIYALTKDFNNNLYAVGGFTNGFTYPSGSQFVAKLNLNTLGLEEISAVKNFKLYPNPFKEELNLSSDNQVIKEISIIDISGKLIKTITNINANAYQLDASFLTIGNYLIQIKTDGGVEVHKVIKR